MINELICAILSVHLSTLFVSAQDVGTPSNEVEALTTSIKSTSAVGSSGGGGSIGPVSTLTLTNINAGPDGFTRPCVPDDTMLSFLSRLTSHPVSLPSTGNIPLP